MTTPTLQFSIFPCAQALASNTHTPASRGSGLEPDAHQLRPPFTVFSVSGL